MGMYNRVFALLGLLAGMTAAPAPGADQPYAVPAADAPALAAPGAYPVGLRRMEASRAELEAPVPARFREKGIGALIWYPAADSARAAERAAYKARLPVSLDVTVKGEDPPRVRGLAVEKAPARDGGPWPLVMISHGFQNWAANMAYLGENLASKGYVVVSIEHNDLPVTDAESRRRSAREAALTRAGDITAMVRALHRAAREKGHFLHGRLDVARLALAGYSMGGFGALTAAGAKLDADSPLIDAPPPGAGPSAKAGLLADRVDALVLIAPWGGAADSRVWKASALAAMEVPTLLIAGSHDDIVGFEGVQWLYNTLSNAPRRFLVYENARHNTGPEPAPPEIRHDMAALERYEEPVWRAGRIMAVNQHFITAHLDAALKEDAAAAAYLDVPTVQSDAGDWGESSPELDALASPAENPDYWPGFHPRWALGLRLHTAAPE